MLASNRIKRGLLAVAALMMAFPACDADVTTPDAHSVVGNWQVMRLDVTPEGYVTGRELISLGASATAHFGTDGHFSFTLSEPDGALTSLSGSWSVSRGKLTVQIHGTGSVGTFQVWVSGTTLALTGGSLPFDLNGDGQPDAARLDMMFEPL